MICGTIRRETSNPYRPSRKNSETMTALQLHVEYRSWSVVDVLGAIRSGTPIIAFVRTQFLDYWQEDVAHAVVIVGAVSSQ